MGVAVLGVRHEGSDGGREQGMRGEKMTGRGGREEERGEGNTATVTSEEEGEDTAEGGTMRGGTRGEHNTKLREQREEG